MLIKMMSRPLKKPQLRQLMKYINQGRDTFENEPHFIIRHNTTGNTPSEVAKDFKNNNLLIPRGKQKRIGVQHIVLSWHPKERQFLDDVKLFVFADKFSKEMDFDNAVAFGRVHKDKENTHLHFAVSASYYKSGKSRRISRAKLKEVQITMNRFQKEKFPELKYSLLYLPKLKKTRETELGIPLPNIMKETDGSIRVKRRGKQSQLDGLRDTLLQLAIKHPEKQDFLQAIETTEDLTMYEKNNIPTGIITDTGKKYRFARLAIDIDNLKSDARLFKLQQRRKCREKQRENTLEK